MKSSAVTTLSGLSSLMVAMTSPGDKVAPSLIWKEMTPASRALRGMYIFMTSISTKDSPAFTCDASATRSRANLPATLEVSWVGSYSGVNMHVCPSSISRNEPPLSSCMYPTWLLPATLSR